MTKANGLGDNAYVNGVDLSGDTQMLNRIAGGNSPLITTDITQSAQARLGGLRDGGIDWTSYFDKAAGASHLTLRALPYTDVLVTYCRGTAIGNAVASCWAKQIGYDPQRGQDGSFLFNVTTVANAYGLEWGQQLTAGKKTDTVATNGTAIDFGSVSSLFGGQAYLQVFSLTGTSVTVKVQDSADNVTFADVTGLAFTAATAAGSQRLATANTATIRRYVRAISTGTFSNAVFAVQFTRNECAGVAF
jgi:hypothetical protein